MRRAAVAALAAAWAGRVAAQALGVSPTLVEIAAGRRAAVISVTNTAATAVDIQVRPYDWRQVDGNDVLTDSSTLILAPAVATIPPGATQALRVLVPTGAREREGEWRLILDQLPQPGGKGLQIRLRLSLPVFAAAHAGDAPDLNWRLVGGRLEVRNDGGRFARLNRLALRDDQGKETAINTGTTPYVLPGTTRSWPATATAVAVAGTIGARDFLVPLPRVPSP